MKTRIFLSSMTILGALVLTGSCSKGIVGTDETVVMDEVNPEFKSGTIPPTCIITGTIADVPIPGCTITGTVTETEGAGLLFMREEEKMARDVYAYMYDKYKLLVFKNITKSESAHMSAVLRLIEGFKIADNSNNNPGEYTNTHIAELYNQLIAMGNVSAIEALKVGVLIEQKDIADLKKELSTVANASVTTVYTNLQAGSNAHLKAFIWNLKVKGLAFP